MAYYTQPMENVSEFSLRTSHEAFFVCIERISFEWRQTSASFFRRNTNDVRPHISAQFLYLRKHTHDEPSRCESGELNVDRTISHSDHSIFHFGRNEVHRNNDRPVGLLLRANVNKIERISISAASTRHNPSNEDLKEGSVQRLSLLHGPHFWRRTFWFSHSPHSTHSWLHE